jgi:predicted RecB family nuclease
MKITNEVLEAYLNCKTKGYLKLVGEVGIQSDYEAMTTVTRRASWETALARLFSRFGEGGVFRGAPATAATLKQGAPLLVDAVLEDDGISICLDAVTRTDGASNLGNYHYLPVLHNHGNNVGRPQKLLLALFGFVVARVQGLRPAIGLVVRSAEGRVTKVRLDAKFYRQRSRCLKTSSGSRLAASCLG